MVDSEATVDDTNEEDGSVAGLCALIEHIATNLVDDPETIDIQAEQRGTAVHIRLLVPEDEMGKVIGREGRIARSMRTLLMIAASRKGLRASLDIGS
jgi:predicted RNA-binding protein YlqC (UPF0109 family)